MFTRRTRKGKSEPMFVSFAPTFEERLKQLRVGARICNFIDLKYEIRILVEKKKIEELVMEKMGI